MENLVWLIAIGAILYFVMRRGGGCGGGHSHGGHRDGHEHSGEGKHPQAKEKAGGCH